MKNPCGTTRANIIDQTEVNGIPVYYGSGVNPVNSPAQFFVAWGETVLLDSLIRTYNSEAHEEGQLWFSDEDEAENKYINVQRILRGNK